MRSKTILLFALAVLAAIVWALRFLPAAPLPIDLADFFGGVAIGLGIGATITWAGERPPRD